MKDNQCELGWTTFVPIWILVNAFCWLAYFALRLMPLGRFSGLIGITLFISWLQYLVLRKYIDIDAMWIWASLLTYGVFSLVLALFSARLTFSSLCLVEILTFGILGYSQSSVLNKYVYHAGYWLVINPISALSGTWISLASQKYFSVIGDSSSTIFWVCFGVVYGSITGTALVYMKKSVD